MKAAPIIATTQARLSAKEKWPAIGDKAEPRQRHVVETRATRTLQALPDRRSSPPYPR
jgi:hypothetical protein